MYWVRFVNENVNGYSRQFPKIDRVDPCPEMFGILRYIHVPCFLLLTQRAQFWPNLGLNRPRTRIDSIKHLYVHIYVSPNTTGHVMLASSNAAHLKYLYVPYVRRKLEGQCDAVGQFMIYRHSCNRLAPLMSHSEYYQIVLRHLRNRLFF